MVSVWNSDNFFLVPESQIGLRLFWFESVQLILPGTWRLYELKAWLFFSSSKCCISSVITSVIFSFCPQGTCKVDLDLTSDLTYSFLISISLKFSSVFWDIPLENQFCGAPGWLSGLSHCLQLRSWSQGPGIESCIGLTARWGACFLLSLCLPFCLLGISLCQINKIFKKINFVLSSDHYCLQGSYYMLQLVNLSFKSFLYFYVLKDL